MNHNISFKIPGADQATVSRYLRIRGLWKQFGNFVALRDISLDVDTGEFVCFLGPSGCGKTTLLRAIAGLDIQTHGTVEQAGKDVSALPPAQRDFGIVFQSYALFPNLTIARNVGFGLENLGHGKAGISERVQELLTMVGLADQADKYPAQLSGGQQQRIALARAIASSPGLLLLDEPLSALDAKVRVSLRHEIKELQRKLGVTTIMVTHDQEEALAMADKIVVMKHGIIEQIGTPTEIYRSPRSLFVADFIGEANHINARLESESSISVGEKVLKCLPFQGHSGEMVTAVIRPEDVIPHAADESGDNCLNVIVGRMEFLGSFWRTRLQHSGFGGQPLFADFSINAVRRLSLSEGSAMTVELPEDRLLCFAQGDQP